MQFHRMYATHCLNRGIPAFDFNDCSIPTKCIFALVRKRYFDDSATVIAFKHLCLQHVIIFQITAFMYREEKTMRRKERDLSFTHSLIHSFAHSFIEIDGECKLFEIRSDCAK